MWTRSYGLNTLSYIILRARAAEGRGGMTHYLGPHLSMPRTGPRSSPDAVRHSPHHPPPTPPPRLCGRCTTNAHRALPSPVNSSGFTPTFARCRGSVYAHCCAAERIPPHLLSQHSLLHSHTCARCAHCTQRAFHTARAGTSSAPARCCRHPALRAVPYAGVFGRASLH